MACGGDCGCQPYFCRLDEMQKLIDAMKKSCHKRNPKTAGCGHEHTEDSGCCKSDHEHGSAGCCDVGTVSSSGSADVERAETKSVEITVQGLDVDDAPESVTGLFTFELPMSSDLEHPDDTDPED